MGVIGPAVGLGVLVLIAATIPRNLIFFANLRYYTAVPWAVPVLAAYLWLVWRYLRGTGTAGSAAGHWRGDLRANPIPLRVWAWSLLAGGLGIVGLVLALRVANRLVTLPQQPLPDLSNVPAITMAALLVMSSLFAGVVEEASFRGLMQTPIERRYGLALAILITGTMFAVVHLDFTPILWPYYVAVAAIYGTITHRANSILPAIVLHTTGNVYSNFRLWLTGRAEWQTSPGPAPLVWDTGPDASFWLAVLAMLVAAAATASALTRITQVELSVPLTQEVA